MAENAYSLRAQILASPDRAKELVERFLAGDPGSEAIYTALAMAKPQSLVDPLRTLMGSDQAIDRLRAMDVLRDAPLPENIRMGLARDAVTLMNDADTRAKGIEFLRTLTDPTASEYRLEPELIGQLLADPAGAVRAEALEYYVATDTTDGVVPALKAGLGDADPVVQESAIRATLNSGVRSADVKSQLLGMASNEGTDPEVRSFSLEALSRFRLTQSESARLQQLKREVGMPKAGADDLDLRS